MLCDDEISLFYLTPNVDTGDIQVHIVVIGCYAVWFISIALGVCVSYIIGNNSHLFQHLPVCCNTNPDFMTSRVGVRNGV